MFGPHSNTLPVARFIRTHKDYKVDRENPPVVPSTLLLDERVEPIRDFILVSFLLLERRRRVTETSTVNGAQAMAVFGAFGSATS